jgi:hypothetical protein
MWSLIKKMQQYLSNKFWANHTLRNNMNIKGKVVNTLKLKDINKSVDFNQEISLTDKESESKDLEIARKRGWIEVTEDKMTKKIEMQTNEFTKTEQTVQQKQTEQTVQQKQTEQTKQVNQNEVYELAKQMASKMVEEMLKNNSFVKEMASQISQQTVSNIKENLQNHIVLQGNQGIEKVPIKLEDKTNNDVFIDFNEDEKNIQSNITEIGIVEEKQDNVSSSIEKLKKFKRK